MQLDTFDTKILNIIQKNSRVQAEEIAEQVGLSASAVQRRLKKMRTEGVIQTEIAVVDPRITSYNVCYTKLLRASAYCQRNHETEAGCNRANEG